MSIGPTNRLPLALLGILDFPSQGRYPNALEETIRSTIDILDIVAASNMEYVGNTAAHSAPGTQTVATVPAGELWYVPLFGIEASAAAAEYITIQPSLQHPSGAVAYRFAVGPQVQSSPYASGWAGTAKTNVNRPFWAAAGDLIQVHVQNCITGASINVTALVGFLRIPI